LWKAVDGSMSARRAAVGRNIIWMCILSLVDFTRDELQGWMNSKLFAMKTLNSWPWWWVQWGWGLFWLQARRWKMLFRCVWLLADGWCWWLMLMAITLAANLGFEKDLNLSCN
jgi:hypothetical protein